VGARAARRRRRPAKLLVTSCLAGAGPLILSTLFDKDGPYVTVVSAMPASLGGTAFLLYTILWVGDARPSTDPTPLTPGKSLRWYGAGVIALLLYGLVLGPGAPR
jgi:hypothetical protein